MAPYVNKVVLLLSSAFGLGYAKIAPGTFGTLAALPLWWLMRSLSWPVFALVTALACGIAVGIAGAAETIYGEHDVGKIVIDEVVGMLVTVVGVPFQWRQVVVAFILFRILDALKPPPIAYFDRHVAGGFGVVIDDVVAGLIGCAILHGLRYLYGGWW